MTAQNTTTGLNAHFAALKTSVHFILRNAQKFEWSLQGMGMLRLHMGDCRLHIWDQNYANPGVSMIHDHLQWSLRSTVIAGSLINQRYDVLNENRGEGYSPYESVTLKAGYGCKFVDELKKVWLCAREQEVYLPGDSYSQLPLEVHESKPQGIVVTFMEKSPTGSDLARVFWPVGTEWGSAEPRKATPEEVAAITAKALALMEAEANP